MRRAVSCTAPVLPAGSTRRYLPSLPVVAFTRSEGILTIAPTSGVPPGLDFTSPDTVVASCAVATAGTSPSRTSPIVKMERTNQRLSVIHFLLLLRFSGPTTGLRERGDGLPARGRRDQPVRQHQEGFCRKVAGLARGRVLTSGRLETPVFPRISYDPCPKAPSHSPGLRLPAPTCSSCWEPSCASVARGWGAETTGHCATAICFHPSTIYPPSSSGVTGWSRLSYPSSLSVWWHSIG